MSSPKQKLRLASTFAALAIFALGLSCTGFFQNPTLTALSVGPSGLNLTVGQNFQMTATGTYNDGSQKSLTSGVVWSSDAASIVSVGATSGMVSGLQIGSANITASSGGCSSCTGSTSVTVVLNNVSSITISPSSQSATPGGSPVYFKAIANPGSIDISGNATWQVFDSTGTDQTTNFSASFVSGLGESFLPVTGTTPGTYTVQASYSGTTIVGKGTLNVN